METTSATPYIADPTARIDEPCSIGLGTRVGPFAHIMSGASIGADCELGHGVVVHPGAKIGDRVHIGDRVTIPDGVTLSHDVYCGPGVAFAPVIRPRNGQARGLPLTKPVSPPKPIFVHHGATLGANAVILGGVTVRIYAMVGAGAVVTCDVPPYAVMTGVPARPSGRICRCAEAILGFRGSLADRCGFCGRSYYVDGQGATEYSPRERSQRAKASVTRMGLAIERDD
jgi:UDP-2-acetamido-3-amino-2,3-dideoxy-glucuronate N-acetyltransferase